MRAYFYCPPVPQSVLIVLKKTWMHNVNTAPGGGGGVGGEMPHFDKLLR